MRQTNRRLTVAALLLSMFLAAMEATAVSTAMPTVIGDLGGVEYYAWVFTIYMLVSTITTPIYGKLSDLIGRKPVLMIGLVIFMTGSVLSGLASNIFALIVFRGIQALGAGAVQTTSLTIVGDIFSIRERGRIQGLFGAVWGFSGIAGPMLGGIIVKYLSWHWIFFINVPFGLASIAILWRAYHEDVTRQKRPLDIMGALWLTFGVLGVLAAANGVYPWLNGLLGLGLLVIFILTEKKAADPIIPLDLFKQPLIIIIAIANVLAGGAMFTAVTYLPLFIQGVVLGSPTQAGAVLTPMLVAWPLASTISGRLLPRFGFRIFIRLGAVILAIAGIVMVQATQTGRTGWMLLASSGLLGTGLGFLNNALIIAVQALVPWSRRGVATASTLFFRTIGGTITVGILGGILRQHLADVGLINNESVNELLSSHSVSGVDASMMEAVAAQLSPGIIPLFWSMLVFGAAMLICAWRFPKDLPEAETFATPSK